MLSTSAVMATMAFCTRYLINFDGLIGAYSNIDFNNES